MSSNANLIRINRHQLSKIFQINGFTLTSEALSLMQNELLNGYPPYQSIDAFIEQIAKILMKCEHKWFIISAETARTAIAALKECGVTKPDQNELIVKNVCDSDAQTNNFLHHYNSLFKYLCEHKLFKTQYKLTIIDSLNTCNQSSIDCIVFGFLRRDTSKVLDKYFILEDSSGQVPLFFTDDTQWRHSVIVDSSFVLIEGTYDSADDALYVNAIGLPPPPALPTLQHNHSVTARMVVVISDIHLNSLQTMEKLKVLFTGYNSSPTIPDCFILTGNFVSKDCVDCSQFKAHMKDLIKMISSFTKVAKNCQFIFVPGFNELNGANQSIPINSYDVDMFPTSTTKIQYYLATNPVNIYIDSRHLCLAAYPLVSKYRKNIIHNTTENSEEFITSIGKLIVSNAHLATGLNKKFNTSLSLTHCPDVLLFNDNKLNVNSDYAVYNNVNFVNMPSFSNDEYKFKVIYTNPILIEDSQILV